MDKNAELFQSFNAQNFAEVIGGVEKGTEPQDSFMPHQKETCSVASIVGGPAHHPNINKNSLGNEVEVKVGEVIYLLQL